MLDAPETLLEACQRKYGRFLFSNIAIETSNFCNRGCTFCPVGIDRKPVERLDSVTIADIFAQLSRLGYVGTICFSWYNEPLADKRLVGFIKDARRACPSSHIYFYTNGDLLDRKLFDNLLGAGLSLLRISQYDGRMTEFVTSVARHQQVTVHVKGAKDLQNSRGGAVEYLLPYETLQARCVRPDEQLIVAATGEVPLCCNDYYVANSIGNIKSLELTQLWNRMEKYRGALRRGDRTQTEICRKCNEPDASYLQILKQGKLI